MTWKWRGTPEVAYVWFLRPTGSAGRAEVRSHQGGVTCVGRGTTILEGDTPPPVNRPLRWTSRTTAIVERLLFEQGWRVMTRREAVGALRNAGLPVSYRASPDSGHLIAQDVADDIRWTTDCEYDTCAFVVRLAAVPLGGEAPPERTTAKRGKVRLEHRGGHDSELWWFSVGPHRYVAAWRTPEWSIWGGPPTPVSDPAPIVVARSIGLSRTQPVTELTVPAGVRWVEDVHNVLRAWVEPWAADQQDTSD